GRRPGSGGDLCGSRNGPPGHFLVSRELRNGGRCNVGTHTEVSRIGGGRSGETPRSRDQGDGDRDPRREGETRLPGRRRCPRPSTGGVATNARRQPARRLGEKPRGTRCALMRPEAIAAPRKSSHEKTTPRIPTDSPRR